MMDNDGNKHPKPPPPGPGRPKGSHNKITRDWREMCKKIVLSPSYRRRLRERANAGELPPAVEVMLWHYAFGKPKESIELTGANGGPLQFMTAEQAAAEIAALEAKARGELTAIDVTPIEPTKETKEGPDPSPK